MKTVGYTRVSTAMQVEHGISLDAQSTRITQYADLHSLTLVGIETDEGLSSKTLERPGLQRALALLDDGSAEALLVTHLDRLTRRLIDLSYLLEHFFKDGSHTLFAVFDSIDTRSASGRLALNILGSVSQWEREAIGERVSSAMQAKRRRKEYTGGLPPYGWTVSKDGRMLVPVKHEQAGIALAHELRASGTSMRKIAARLAEAGYLSRSGSPMGPSAVSGILESGAEEGIGT